MAFVRARPFRGPATLLCLLASTALIAACGSSPSGGTANGSSATTTASSGSCATGAAAPGSTLTVPEEPASGVSTPQGSCWSSIKPTPITVVDTGTQPSGTSASFQVAWSAQDLYIRSYSATWPLENQGNAAAGNWWESDCTEFDISGANDHGGVFTSGNQYQLGVTTDGVLQTSGANGSGASPAPTPKVQIVNGKGWYAELIVPWATLQVKPAKGGTYQFDIGEDYGSSTGTRLVQLAWQAQVGGSTDWHNDTSQWGDIVLG